MIARCARCQGTFTTDRFGLQTCPHCGSELLLADPNAPPPAGGQAPAGPPSGAQPPPERPPPAAPPAAPPPAAGGLPPAAPPSGGWGAPPGGAPPSGGWGPPPGGAGVPPPGGWGPPPGGLPPAELPSPFAERAQRGFFSAFFETWKLVATQPQQFFRRVRTDQTGTAILFGVIAVTAGNAMAGLYNWLSGQQALLALRSIAEKMPEEQGRIVHLYMSLFSGGMTLAQVLLAPILSLLFMYVGAGILHLLLMLFRGAKRPFDATLTVVAYAQGLNLLLAVPGCGGLLAAVWGLVVLVIGLGEAQRCGSGKAAAAVLTPALLLCACCCLGAGLSVPALLKSLEAAKQGTQTTNL
jgi:hypothetical protein